MDHSRPPTLNDIAQKAGLAKSTVSEALRDHGRVRPATRARVRALARRMGYVPNIVAATLASSKSVIPALAQSVALVTTLKNYHWNNGKLVNSSQFGTRDLLHRLGYEMEVFDSAAHSAPALRNLLYHRGFRGVIFHQVDVEAEPRLLEQDWGAFCVLGGTRNFGLKFDLVRNNHFRAACLAWNQARSRGYTRIGAVLGRHRPALVDDYEREGAIAVFQRHLAPHETAIPPYLGTFQETEVEVPRWYRRHRPDVVLGINYSFSAKQLIASGVRIPQDVAFISLVSDYADCARLDPETHVPQIWAEQMDQMIRQQRVGAPEFPREILPSVRWIPGPTLPGEPVAELEHPFRYDA